MRRGDIVTVAAGGGHAGKPRPAVVVQSDDFVDTASVTVCLMTSQSVDAPLLHIAVEPDPDNGLALPSWVMVDKLVTVPREKVGARIGVLSDTQMTQLSRAMFVFLGMAGA